MKQYLSGAALSLILLVSNTTHCSEVTEAKEGAERKGRALIRFVTEPWGSDSANQNVLGYLSVKLGLDAPGSGLRAAANQNTGGPQARFLRGVTDSQAIAVLDAFKNENQSLDPILLKPTTLVWAGWIKNVLGVEFEESERVKSIREKLLAIAQGQGLDTGRSEAQAAPVVMRWRVHNVEASAETQGRTGLTDAGIETWNGLRHEAYAGDVKDYLREMGVFGALKLTGLEVSGIDQSVISAYDFKEPGSQDLPS